MKFGVFDHLDASGAPLEEFFEHRLQLVEAYERAGIHSYHTAEHHATPLGMAPSPSVLHAAVAQRTKRILFGPCVYTLNLYHPLRLAEEICMLDHMSRGRFQLGVGRGISPFELQYFGADPKVGQEMYVEAFNVIMKAFQGGRLTHEGTYYNYKDVPIQLLPKQRPHPPLWYGIGNPESVEWCVANRTNIITNAPPALMRTITDRYRNTWAAQAKPGEVMPLMGTSRHFCVARTDAEAIARARRAYKHWYAGFIYLWKLNGGTPRFATYTEDFDALLEGGQAIAGSPETVTRKIREQIDKCGVTYLLCRFAFGDLSLGESLESLDLFTRHVMPVFADAARAAA